MNKPQKCVRNASQLTWVLWNNRNTEKEEALLDDVWRSIPSFSLIKQQTCALMYRVSGLTLLPSSAAALQQVKKISEPKFQEEVSTKMSVSFG